MLIGTTIALRPFEPRHFETSVRWVNDPEIARMVDRVRPVTREEEQTWYRRMLEDPTQVLFAVEMLKEERHIGNCGLKAIDARVRKAELWIYLGDKSIWGRGIGQEASRLLVRYGFQSLNLNRIYLYCPEYNDRALRLYQRCGFKPEGQLREDVFQDGRYWNAVRLSLLRSEWKP